MEALVCILDVEECILAAVCAFVCMCMHLWMHLYAFAMLMGSADSR